MKKITVFAWLLAVLSTMVPAIAVGFSDNFNSIDPAWVTDRYEPAGFSSVSFDGDNRLKIDISTTDSAANRPGAYSSAFYNTQGRQRPSAIDGDWLISADLYVSADMIDGSSLRRTDIWARTSTDGSEPTADYPIFGMAQFDLADPFNPSAANIDTMWRVWDPDTGGWVISGAAVTSGWHNLMIAATASDYKFYLDGSLIYTDSTSANSFDKLTTTFVQAYNFGNENYSVYWDNISASAGTVSTPDAGATLPLLAGVFGGIVVFARRKK